MITSKRILILVAHPDDADVHSGGTIARWADEGYEAQFVVATSGDKGHDDPTMTPERVVALRQSEQRRSAEILGVARVMFLDYRDGDLAWAGPRLVEDLSGWSGRCVQRSSSPTIRTRVRRATRRTSSIPITAQSGSR